MCDILAISAGYNHTPQKYLPIFAEKGKENMNGWGIGFFREDRALVEKSDEQVFCDQQVHESFQRLARVIDSRIIIAHVNCPRSGGHHSTQLHPFTLNFLDHNWLFVQIGVAEKIKQYQTHGIPRLEADGHSARTFEYLRDQMILLNRKNPYISLYIALRISIQTLLTDYSGNYTFFLANESVLFAFCNYRQLMVLKATESMGDILLVTSVRDGLSRTDWHPIMPEPQSQGELLVIAGPDVLYAEDV
jgi:predicted glutamine amidotransferase